MPGWLRALFFLPAGTSTMAHRDPNLAELGRHMAHQGGLGPSDSPLHGDIAPARHSAHPGRRHFHTREQRRREAATVLGLLVAASALSIAGPVSGLGTVPEPTPIYIIADGPNDQGTGSSGGSGVALVPAGTQALDPTYLPPPTPKPTKKPTPRPTRVRTFVALGDSLTAWPAYNPWPSRLDAQDNLLTLLGNAGVPGNTTSQMRSRLSSDVYPLKPEVLFVLGGTNDLGLGISQSAIIANLRAIIVDAKAHKIMPILITIPPDSYPNMVPKIKALNAAIVTLGNSQRVNVVDIYGVLANGDGVFQPKYTSDGLHFSDLGCQTVANTIRSRIRRLGL